MISLHVSICDILSILPRYINPDLFSRLFVIGQIDLVWYVTWVTRGHFALYHFYSGCLFVCPPSLLKTTAHCLSVCPSLLKTIAIVCPPSLLKTIVIPLSICLRVSAKDYCYQVVFLCVRLCAISLLSPLTVRSSLLKTIAITVSFCSFVFA